MLRRANRNTLFCFSPPVMIATFAIEIILALYTLWRYTFSTVTRLAALLLVFLATFQLAEFMVCRGMGGNALAWSRLGFVAITMLPPLGVHLVYAIAGAKKRPLVIPSYVAAGGFMAFFALVDGAIQGNSCLGNYVIFDVAPKAGGLYGLYYYGFLIVTLVLGWMFLHRKTTNKPTKKALSALMVGYTIFLLPTTTTVSFLAPQTLTAIPSVMCGFAVLLALVLSFRVLPLVAKEK